MDKISLLLVQNLALADFLYVFCNVLPSAVSYIARRYILGKVYCFFSAQMSFTFAQVNTITVLAITAYRLQMLRSPLSRISRGSAKIGCVVIWITASTTTVICLAYRSESIFSQKSAKCFSSIYINQNPTASVLFRISFGGVVIIPLISIFIINIILFTISLRSSRKHMGMGSRESINARALTTVCALSTAFMASWTPYLIFLMWKGADPNPPFVVEQVGITCIMINSFCNPILYTMTNRRFGRFVWTMVRFDKRMRSGPDSTTGPFDTNQFHCTAAAVSSTKTCQQY